MVDRWKACCSLPSRARARAAADSVGHRPRRLRRVADDGPRRGAPASTDHPPLHRREVLRLVDEHVREAVVLDPVRGRCPGAAGGGVLAVGRRRQLLQVDALRRVVERVVVVGALRDVAEDVAQLVDQRHVLDREHVAPGPGLARAGPGPRSTARPRRPATRTPGRAASRARRSPSSGGHHEAAKSTKDRWDSSSSSNASRPRSRPRSPRTWRHSASSSAVATRGSWRLRGPWFMQPAADRGQRPAVQHRDVVAVEDPELLDPTGDGLPRGPAHQLGHPLGALDVGDRRLVVAPGLDPVDDLAERAQRDRRLPEAGEHPLDVAHEDAGRADDEHPAALVAATLGVEQVRRAVQRDHRLAGPGAAGDGDHALAGRPDRLVLLGLDGGDDRVHGAVPGAGQLGHQGTLADHGQPVRPPGCRRPAARPRPRRRGRRSSAARGVVRRSAGSAAVAW